MKIRKVEANNACLSGKQFMRALSSIVTVISWLWVAHPATAQMPTDERAPDPDPTRLMDLVPSLRSEQSELGYALVSDNSPATIFEGRIVPNLFLNGAGGRFALEVTPKVRLRMFRAHSSPVRSPSFMPRVTLYYVPDREWVLDAGRPGTIFTALVSHHSNGQDGEFFNTDGSINTVDGSFSTNFVEFGVHRLYFPSVGPLNGIAVGGVAIEQHLWFNQSEGLDGRYSESRLNLTLDYLHSGEVLKELDLDVVVMLDRYNGLSHTDLRRWNWEATVRVAPPSILDATVFLKLYRGQDYYNMRFDDRITLVQVGLSVDFSTWAPVGYP